MRQFPQVQRSQITAGSGFPFSTAQTRPDRREPRFDDPPALAKLVEGDEAKLDCYRRVRDEIRAFVETLPEALGRGAAC